MSLELNKILGAVLGTAAFTLAISIVADVIFEPEPMAQPGYAVATGEAAPAAAAPVAEAVAPIADRLKTADAAAGEKSAKACGACHNFDPAGTNKVGPGLYELVGRTPGTHPGYAYSAAMADFGKSHTWDYETLDVYLTNPKTEVPGNKMAFAGLKKPDDRANVIAYLRSLSADPKPLP